MEQIVLKAFAKINLCLDITGVNPDGYHELDTIMQSVDLYDTVSVMLNKNGKVTVECSNSSICGDDNIVLHAAKLFLAETNSVFGADIYIDKKIPLRSGLGGGSADAATVLNALNILLGNPISTEKLLELGLTLGADVPFCILGGTKRCKGIGEILIEAPKLNDGYFVLLNCGNKESTKQMYKTIDETKKLHRPNVDIIISSLQNKDYSNLVDNCRNVFSNCYDLQNIKKDVLASGADVFCISGSGSYGFGLLKDFNTAQKCKALLEQMGYKPIVCSPKSCGFEIL